MEAGAQMPITGPRRVLAIRKSLTEVCVSTRNTALAGMVVVRRKMDREELAKLAGEASL